eukprot:tig00000903_g5520.t1
MADDDAWDADDFTPSVPVVNVKPSWEDEEEPEPAKSPAPKAGSEPQASGSTVKEVVKPKKAMKEAMKRVEEKKGGASVGRGALASAADFLGDEVDPELRRLHQQRQQQAADFQSAQEMFGDVALDEKVPKTEEEFNKLAQILAEKLQPLEASFHFTSFLKTLVRLTTTSLTSDNLKELSASCTVLMNEKLKAEKDKSKKKKPAAATKKASVAVERTMYDEDDDYGGDDYDFM